MIILLFVMTSLTSQLNDYKISLWSMET